MGYITGGAGAMLINPNSEKVFIQTDAYTEPDSIKSEKDYNRIIASRSKNESNDPVGWNFCANGICFCGGMKFHHMAVFTDPFIYVNEIYPRVSGLGKGEKKLPVWVKKLVWEAMKS
jgi:hypothetical protein